MQAISTHLWLALVTACLYQDWYVSAPLNCNINKRHILQYARYFGGDLRLISMDGFGTDVYIHLNKLSSSAEPLP
jgi:hypothetical protein